MKLLSGILFIGLSVASFKLQIVIGLASTIDIYTYNSADWQIMLAAIYALIGFFNIVLWVIDILTEWRADR